MRLGVMQQSFRAAQAGKVMVFDHEVNAPLSLAPWKRQPLVAIGADTREAVIEDKPMRRLYLAAALLAWSVPSHAAIISGEIVGGSVLNKGGMFVELKPVRLGKGDLIEIGADSFDDPNLYGFNESQNVRSQAGITVDIGRDIAMNELVASHYLAFDPIRDRVQARITFDSRIIGVATSTQALDASDYLAATGVDYQNTRGRGLEGKDILYIDENDLFTLVLDLGAASPGDFVRVFTERSPSSPVPIPSGMPLFAAGIAMLATVRRRTREQLKKA